jgi:Ca-activated chloride channel homolog
VVVTAASERLGNGHGGFFEGYRVRIRPRRGIATPAIHGTAVIFGGGFGSHDMYAVDRGTGTLRWHLRTRDDGPTAAVVVDGIVLFNTESCTLMAADAGTGALLWEKWLGDPLLAQPAAADGRVVMVYPRQGTHWLGAFDVRSGRQVWETETKHDVITAPVINDRHVYLTTYDGAVICVDVATGHPCWTKAMNATSAPFVVDGRVYVAHRHAGDVPTPDARSSSRVAATPWEQTSYFHAHNGVAAGATDRKRAAYLNSEWGRHRKARFGQDDAAVGFAQPPAAAKMHAVRDLIGERHVSRAFRFQGSRPTVSNGVLFETTGDRLEATDLASGRRAWSWDNARSEEGERRLTPPAVANDRVLVGTWDGRVISFDAATGHTRWEVHVGAPCHWQPVMSDGRIFAGLEDGSVVAFDTGDPKDDGWPMWGGGPGHNGPCAASSHDASVMAAHAEGQERQDDVFNR